MPLRRGSSFVQEYSNATPQLTRGPSMLKGPYCDLVPPADSKKYTVVLDLDETVIYARAGPLEVRPHFDEFLALLDGCCEIIVWTAGIRNYAKAVIRNIDEQNIIAHCIYRHENWFRPEDYTKDLTRLGRPLDKVLIVENTPDCVRNNPHNGVIVQDYEGGEENDDSLRLLAQLVQDLCKSGASVPEFLERCPLVELKAVSAGLATVEVYCLKSKAAGEKVVKENRDRSVPQTKTKNKAIQRKRERKQVQNIVAKARRSSLLPRRSSVMPRRSPRIAEKMKRVQERKPWR